MLAQILHDLHVPRELLEQLPEDQKQVLFCKMREEQVRRYHQREEEEEALRIVTPIGNHGRKKKQVTFRLGADGNEWCWIMGEPLKHPNESFNKKMNNENMDIDHQNDQRQSKSATHHFPVKTGVYYQVHRDERKQIGEISNNIQEARRVFESLESETRRLALSKENEILHKQPRCSTAITQSDFVDETFYHRLEERAKKADQERRETARRARDYYQRHSSQENLDFDTNDQQLFTMEPILLNREKIEDIDREIPAFPLLSSTEIENKEESLVNTDTHQSNPHAPRTRADIRQWFCINEIPYGKFRSSTGQIHPWFHGIISRGYAEQLLSSKPIGSYLIRLSERIYGYVLSYHASDHCRHLLIEVTSKDHTYRFVGGAKKESFANLSQLIEKYSNTPIRSNSSDVLRFPCDQLDSERADYADLFLEHNENSKLYESLYISLDTTTSSLQSTTHL